MSPFAGESNPLDSVQVKATVERVEKVLEGRGRVLLRASGTEPLIRVMVEGNNESEVHQLTREIADSVVAA